MSRSTVVLLGPEFREYRRHFFERMGQCLGGRDIRFLVAHAQANPTSIQRGEIESTSPSLPLLAKRWEVMGRGLLVSALPPEWMNADLVVVPEHVGYPTAMLLVGGRAVRGRRTAVFGHGTDFARPGRDDIVERVNVWRMRHVDWWFAYNDLSAEAVVKRGMPSDRVTPINNTLDTDALVRVAEQQSADDRRALRQSLGLGSGPVGLFIGTIYRGKRLDVLVAAVDRVRDAIPDFSLVVVGDGAEAREVDAAARTRPWLHRLPGDTSDQRGRYWALADLALYPTAGGLAINEALALGVPPVIMSGYPHSPEAGYIEHDRNGLVVEGADPEAYADAIVDLIGDGARRRRLSHGARLTGRELSLQNMVDRFCDGIEAVLARPPRRQERR